MKTTSADYFKMKCPKCGQSIECPNEAYDTIVDCPTCGDSVLARPPLEEAQKTKTLPRHFAPRTQNYSAAKRAVALLVVIILAGGLIYMLRDILPAMVGGTAGLAVVVLVVLVAVLWILFPVFVYFGMQRQEKILRQIEENTRGTKI